MLEAAVRLVPEGLLRPATRLYRLAQRPEIWRLVIGMSIVLLGAAYARALIHVYKGDDYVYWETVHNATGGAAIYLNQADVRLHGYLYSPAFIQALWPLLSLPWLVFHGIWIATLMLITYWLARPWVVLLTFPFIFKTFGVPILAIPRHELDSGNIFLLLTLAVVAGFRWPWTFSFLLLTKATPGVVLLWFVVRREWRNLAIALGCTAVIAAVSFAIAPHLWFDWVNLLRTGSGLPEPDFAIHFLPLYPRLAIAVVITVLGARTNQRWVLPIAAMLALPFIADTALMMLFGVLPLLRNDPWTRVPARPAEPPEGQRPGGEPAVQG